MRSYADGSPAEIVLERARSRLDESDYDLLRNNCEHFAVWCKTGIRQSSQATAIHASTQEWLRGQWVSLALIRVARRLPPPYRPWAYGGVIVVSGTSLAARYAHRRWKDIARGES